MGYSWSWRCQRPRRFTLQADSRDPSEAMLRMRLRRTAPTCHATPLNPFTLGSDVVNSADWEPSHGTSRAPAAPATQPTATCLPGDRDRKRRLPQLNGVPVLQARPYHRLAVHQAGSGV